MNWIILLLAGMLETAWAVGLKFSDGLNFAQKPLPSALTVIAMVASMWLLGVAIRTLPLGTAYAVWTGIGTAGAVILGIFLFHEPATFVRIACVCLIMAGIAGLKLSAA